MNLAERLLSERIKRREREARQKYAEGSQLKRAQYEVAREERCLLAEHIHLESEEAQVLQKRAELEQEMQRRSFEPESNMKEVSAGCSRETALPADEVVSWWRLLGRPWTCGWRVFLVLSIVASIVLGVVAKENRVFSPVYAVAMAGCIPLSISFFFAELATHVGVKYRLLAAVFALGGVLSVTLTIFVNQHLPDSAKDAIFAGIVEEPCKGAVLVSILVMLPRFKGTLAGLAFGSAIGAGFATIETFDYAYAFGENGMPSTTVLVLRTVLSPLMHTGWTAALGGALWFVQHPFGVKNSPSRWCCVVVVLAAMIGCHCLWNSGTPVGYAPLIVWIVIFYYAKRGVLEIEVLGRRAT